MQKLLSELSAQLTDLDVYTQRSIIGSWAFAINQQCITQAMRELPNVPEESAGIDGYTAWEGALRTLEKKLLTHESEGGDYASPLPAFIALQRHVSFMMVETGGDPASVESTHAFLASLAPTRSRFEADFATRVKMGMRPGISRKEFVDAEYARALDQHEKIAGAKGEHAVELIDRMVLKSGASVERGFDDIPEWMGETFQQKMIQKLKDRWIKLEMTRTNPRVNSANRDAAEGDQFLIVEALTHFGEVPHEPVVDDDE